MAVKRGNGNERFERGVDRFWLQANRVRFDYRALQTNLFCVSQGVGWLGSSCVKRQWLCEVARLHVMQQLPTTGINAPAIYQHSCAFSIGNTTSDARGEEEPEQLLFANSNCANRFVCAIFCKVIDFIAAPTCCHVWASNPSWQVVERGGAARQNSSDVALVTGKENAL